MGHTFLFKSANIFGILVYRKQIQRNITIIHYLPLTSKVVVVQDSRLFYTLYILAEQWALLALRCSVCLSTWVDTDVLALPGKITKQYWFIRCIHQLIDWSGLMLLDPRQRNRDRQTVRKDLRNHSQGSFWALKIFIFRTEKRICAMFLTCKTRKNCRREPSIFKRECFQMKIQCTPSRFQPYLDLVLIVTSWDKLRQVESVLE